MAAARGSLWRSSHYALLLACEIGCANPNLHTTPRATPVGRVTSFVAPQLIARPELQQRVYGVQLGGRYGLASRLDAGARTNFGSFAFDLKWNAVRGQRFDLALDAGLQLMPSTLYVDLPVLLGINLSDSVSILPTTGIMLGEGRQPSLDIDKTEAEDVRHSQRAGRLFLRAGLGAQFRVSSDFAVNPELTYLVPTEGSVAEYLVFGLGFCFGKLPY
jgi:hypothetical protein